jgi:hypothetical protein
VRSVLRPASVLLAAGLGAAVLTALPVARPAAAAVAQAGSFVPVAPTRVVDTRSGIAGNPKGAVGPNAAINAQIGGKAGVPSTNVSAVAVTISTVTPTEAGVIVAWAAAEDQPGTANVQFAKGQQVSTLSVVPVSSGGAIKLANRSSGRVHLVVDVSGYFVDGSATATSSFVPVAPERAVDTRTGAGGNRKGALGADATFGAGIGGRAHVPTSGVSAVVVTITAVTPSQTGGLVAWADRAPRPAAINVQFAKGRPASNLAVVPVSASGRIDLSNRSSGTVHVVVDVFGYFRGGVPTTAGTLGSLSPGRVLDTRNGTAGNRKGSIPANTSIGVQVGGNGGVPRTGVSAVVVTISSVTPAAAGAVTAWDAGAAPSVTNLQFRAGEQVSDLAVVPVTATGKITVVNRSSGALHLVIDVSGYYLKSDLTLPATSPSRYVRNLTGDATSNASKMMAEGHADAAAGAKLVVLDIGAQLNDKSGVQLSATKTKITYDQLADALKAYLTGFGPASGVTIAVATNNDANDWTHYPAGTRGNDWANKVVDQLVPPAGVTVVGADDIEGAFFSTEAQAQAWETAYLSAATTKKLIFVGSADGCPTTFGATGKSCSFGWTQAQYYALAGGTNPTHIQALPQIYLPQQAVQWAGIDATGGKRISFAGALTEHAACLTAGTNGCGFAALPADQGWAALYLALGTLATPAPIPGIVTDLEIDS